MWHYLLSLAPSLPKASSSLASDVVKQEELDWLALLPDLYVVVLLLVFQVVGLAVVVFLLFRLRRWASSCSSGKF